jgi:hypothetical protein
MAQADNPAGRLFVLLTQAMKAPGHKNVAEVWSEVLGVAPKDRAKLLHRYALVISEYHAAKNAVQKLNDVDTTLYLRPFDRIAQFFSRMNFDQPWEKVAKILDAPTLQGIEFVSDRLARDQGENAIEDATLRELQDAINSLFEAVLKAEIEPGIKDYILRCLSDLQNAILEYRIRGAVGMVMAVESALGSAFRYRESIETARRGKSKETIDTFFRYLKKYDAIASAATKTKNLLAPAVQMLLENLS